MTRLAAAITTGLLAVPLAVSASAAGSTDSPQPGKPLTVMTRNLYLGADINRPVQAARDAEAAGATPQEVLVALANATHVTRAIVDETDFPTRSKLLATEIARTEPDLVGLQEVALWRSGPLDLAHPGVPDATVVDYDFLDILLDDLADLGVDYRAVTIGVRADVEAPSFTGSPFDGTIGGSPRDIRLTMHDVILMRRSALRVTGSGDRVFAHNLVVPVAGVAMRFNRGFQWVDVRAGADRVRFYNTHLEAFSSDLALAQAAEMMAHAPTGRDVVVACDCNSDPLNSSVKPHDTVPHKAPYELITDVFGFTDQWLEWLPASQGWTSGLSEFVDDETAKGFDHRIDMIFGRSDSGEGFDVDLGEVTGDEVEDRDPATGLWPSDHAGVVLRLRGL